MENTSTRWVFNGIDIVKTLRTFLMVSLASGALWLLNTIVPGLVGQIPAKYAIFMPIVTLVVEGVRRWATDYTL